MLAEGVVIPLWGKLILLSLSKKALVLTAGYLYGFPRLYRRSQKLVRYVSRDPNTKTQLQGYVRTAFRLPARLLHPKQKQPVPPALQYLSLLPSRLLPASKGATGQVPAAGDKSRGIQTYSRLSSSFASSPMTRQQSGNWVAGKARLASLRERFSGSGALQSAVESRAEHAAEMWRKFKRQPYIFVPSVQ